VRGGIEDRRPTVRSGGKVGRPCHNRGPERGEKVEKPLVVGLRDRAILATLAYTACRAGAVAKLRLGDFQDEGSQYVLRFQEKGGKSREIPVRHDLEGFIMAYVNAAGIAAEAKDSALFREREKGTSLISTACEGSEPRGHARKRLMQAA